MRIKRRKLTSKPKRDLTTVAAGIPANLSTITPLQPFCSPFYGVLNLDKSKWLRCYRATSRKPWPPGNKVYAVKPRGRYASPYHLPARYVDTETNCAITLELAGPKLQRFVEAALRDLAAVVHDLIKSYQEEEGEFMVRRFDHFLQHITNLRANLDDTYPLDTSLITFTISSSGHLIPFPSDYDPEIANTLASHTKAKAMESADLSRRSLLLARAERWSSREEQTSPRSWGRRINWWRDPYEVANVADGAPIGRLEGQSLTGVVASS